MGLVVVALAAVVPYLGALGNGFAWDDLSLIVRDEALASAKGVWQRLGQDFFAASRDPASAGYWRPLVTLSFALDRAIWGLSPRGFHLTNLFLHAICAVLVVVLLRAIAVNLWVATSAGVLFALHPKHAESVAFISGRTDTLAALLVCLAMLLHLRGARTLEAGTPRDGVRGRWLHAAAVGFYLLGLLAKEMAVVMIPWLAVLHLVVERRGWRRSAVLLVPFVGATLAYLAVRLLLVQVDLPEAASVSVGAVLLTAPATFARYLQWLVVPFGLQGFVQNPPVTSALSLRFVIGAGVLVAASWGLVMLWRRSRPTFALGTMSVLALAPLLHVLPIKGPPDMGLVMAERFLYFASIPFVGLLAQAAAAVTMRLSNRYRALVAGLALAGVGGWWSAMIVARVPDWRDDVTLFSVLVRDAPHSPTMVANLANAHVERGDFAAAAAVFSRAPSSVLDQQPVLLARAQVLAADGRFAEAIPLLEAVTASRWPGDGRARNNLACLYRLNGRLDEATGLLEELVREGNDLPETFVNLVEAFAARGEKERASMACQQGLARFPDDPGLVQTCRGRERTAR